MTDPINLSKFTRKLSYASTGVIGEDSYLVGGMRSLRVSSTIESSGIVIVEARLESEPLWTNILSLEGDGTKQSETVFIDTWDYIRFRCTKFISTGAYIYTSAFTSADSVPDTSIISNVNGRNVEVTANKQLKVTLDDGVRNTLQTVATTITTTATKINTPEDTGDFVLYHNEAGETVFIGNSSITAAGFNLTAGEKYELKNMEKDNGNELYAIVASGSLILYVTGVVSE